MADQHQNHHMATGTQSKTKKTNMPDAAGRSIRPEIHTQKNGTDGSFVPPPMETITGKRMMQEASGRLHTHTAPPIQNPDMRKEKGGNTNAFVPSSIDKITGESVMPITGKRMVQEDSGRYHAHTAPPVENSDMHTAKGGNVNVFVPSSINMITGESVMPMEGPAMPLAPSPDEAPEMVQNPYYAAGYLKNYIGRNMRVQFLIGANGALVDRTGTLIEVGASYIVLRPDQTDDLLMCDLYSIKFVTIYR